MTTKVHVETIPDYLDVEFASRGAFRRSEGRLTMSAVAVLSLALLAIGYAADIEALRLIGVFGALIAGVGAAPLQLSDRPSMVERVGVAIVFGLSVAILASSIMVLVPFWHPVVIAALIAAAAAAAHVVGARRALRGLRARSTGRELTVAAPSLARVRAVKLSPPSVARLRAVKLPAPTLARLRAVKISPPSVGRLRAVKVPAPSVARLRAVKISPPSLARLRAVKISPPSVGRLRAVKVPAPSVGRLRAAKISPPTLARLRAAKISPPTLARLRAAKISPPTLARLRAAKISPPTLARLRAAKISPPTLARVRAVRLAAPGVARLWAATSPSLRCTVAGTALWLGAAVAQGHLIPGAWGFLPHISAVWYVGLLLLIAAIVLAARLHEVHVASAVISLTAALTITPALVYGMPRSQSAVKHAGIVDLILHTHHLDPGASIYYAYSGFFAAMAWLSHLAGVANPLGLATFWPFIVGMLGIAELRFLFGRLIRSPYRCWIGVMLAVLANAVGQDYFSPQSTGYVVALGVFGIAIIGAGEDALPPRAKTALLLLTGCALAVTHELSPYVAGGVLIVLAMFHMVRPRWAAATILIPAGLWAAANFHVLSQFFNFAALGNLSNFAPPHTATSTGLHRLAIVGDSSHALLLGLLLLVILALVGFVRNRTRAGSWALMLSAGVGIVFIAINPYGDEGIFRAALFGIPWLVMLGLAAVRKPRWRWLAVGPPCCILLATFMTSQFGLDQTNVVHRSDVGALDAFVAQAPPGSYYLEVGQGDLPSTLDPALHNLTWDALWNLKSQAQTIIHARVPPTPADFGAFTQAYINYGAKVTRTPARNLFAVWSTTEAMYSVNYGVETMANAREWLNMFLHSPRWRVLYGTGYTYLFRYVPLPGSGLGA